MAGPEDSKIPPEAERVLHYRGETGPLPDGPEVEGVSRGPALICFYADGPKAGGIVVVPTDCEYVIENGAVYS